MAPDISAYGFQFDCVGILDFESGVWAQRTSPTGDAGQDFLYDTYASFNAGQVPFNDFNGLNAEFSAVANPLGATNGAIATSDDWDTVNSRMIWMGDGIPPFEQPVLCSDLDAGDQPTMLPVVYGLPLETGSYFVNGKYWFVGRDTQNGVYAIFSCPNPGEGGNWTYVDAGNGPPLNNAQAVGYNPVTKTLYLLIGISASNSSLYSIQLSAVHPTWSGPFASFDPTTVSPFGMNNGAGNVNALLIPWANGDFGICFQVGTAGFDNTGASYYVRYNSVSPSWDAAVLILAGQGQDSTISPVSSALIDPVNPDLAYVLVHSLTGGNNMVPLCLTVTRLGVVATAFTFPTLTITGGFGDPVFGHSVIYKNKLHVSLPIVVIMAVKGLKLGDPPPEITVEADWVSDLGAAAFVPNQLPATFTNPFGDPVALGIAWLFFPAQAAPAKKIVVYLVGKQLIPC